MRLARERVPGWMEQIGHTLALAVWGNHGPTIVHWEESPQAVTANLRLGDVMPLLSSATGRCFAAYMPPEAVARPCCKRAGPGRRCGAPTCPPRWPGAGCAGRCARAWRPGWWTRCCPASSRFAPRCSTGGHLALGITTLGSVATFDPEWVAPSRCRCGCRRPAFHRSGRRQRMSRCACPPGLLHCQGPLMPRRTLWILTALCWPFTGWCCKACPGVGRLCCASRQGVHHPQRGRAAACGSPPRPITQPCRRALRLRRRPTRQTAQGAPARPAATEPAPAPSEPADVATAEPVATEPTGNTEQGTDSATASQAAEAPAPEASAAVAAAPAAAASAPPLARGRWFGRDIPHRRHPGRAPAPLRPRAPACAHQAGV